MSIADALGFSDENGALSSFVNLVKILQTFDDTEAGFNWASYLTCISVMPGAGARPTHPLHLPLGFPPEGPPDPLPKAVAESMERRFATLRGIWEQLAESKAVTGEPDADLIVELGPRALAAIRGLGDDLEVHRFPSGEGYVLGLKLRQAIPADGAGGAELIQILQEVEELWESYLPGAKRLSVTAWVLVYRLPRDAVPSLRAPAHHRTWDALRQEIEGMFTALFPGQHAVVELRDADGATLLRGQVSGPGYDAVKQKYDDIREKHRKSET